MNRNTARDHGISRNATKREASSGSRHDSSNRRDALAAVWDESHIEPHASRRRRSDEESVNVAAKLLREVLNDEEASKPFREPSVGLMLTQDFRERRADMLRDHL